MFGLGKLLYIIILSVNGIAVLSEDRFLNRIGWSTQNNGPSGEQYQQFMTGVNQNDNQTIKTRLINLIGAIRTLLRVPLIAINVIIILYELVLG